MPLSAQANNMLTTLEKKRMALEAEIAEAKARLPAHSVKPAQMMPLLALEDEYETLLKRIQAVKQDSKSK